MGDREHMSIALRGVQEWNDWRQVHLRVQPDLTRIDLSGRDLSGIDFRGVGLFKANLSGANLRNANLRQSILIRTNFKNADLTGAHVYGASVWDVNLEGAIQNDLVVTEPPNMNKGLRESNMIVTTDNLEMAQFLHLLMTNKKLRDVIDTITSKVVLILGRFSKKRKPVLDRLKMLCREYGLLPVLFDFEGPESRNTTETIQTLAFLSRFIIADLTFPKCIPQELQATIPGIKVPFAPLIRQGAKPHSMFRDLAEYPWVIEPNKYNNLAHLAEKVFPKLLKQVETKLAEIRNQRRRAT
jgi:hypothetical protein